MPATMTNTGMNSAKTQSAMRGANPENFNPILTGRAMRPPMRTIYLFSVAKRSFIVRNPPLFPRLELKGCENNERFVRCTSIPDPIVQVSQDHERGGTRPDDHDAWIAAIDMLCPGNFTTDLYAGSNNPTYYANSNGTNLVCEGVFLSLNEEPTEAEIRQAEQARDKRYRYLVGEARRLANKSKAELDEFLQRWPDTHIAMDALGMTADWHTSNEFRQACENCGDLIKPGLAFHQSSAGVLCVIDPQRAFKAGAINRERFAELTAEENPEIESEPTRRGPGRPRKADAAV